MSSHGSRPLPRTLVLSGMLVFGADPLPAQLWLDLRYVAALSPFGSSPTRSVSSNCPAGYVDVGGGAALYNAALNRVALLWSGHAGSTTTPTGWASFAYELDPLASNWAVTAEQVCGRLVELPGYVRLTALSPLDSTEDKEVSTPPCPVGKVPIGGGAKVIGAAESIGLTCSTLTSLRDGWRACGRELHSTAGNWRVQAEVLCADTPPGYVVVAASTDHDYSYKSLDVACPSGTVALGGGACVLPFAPLAGAVGLTRSAVARALAFESPGGPRVAIAWRGAAGNLSGWDYPFSLDVVAVCAKGVVVLFDDFESGDTSAWSSTTP